MSKAVALKQTTQLSTQELEILSDMPDADQSDLVIPSLIIVQKSSALAVDDTKPGHIVNNQTKEILGGLGKALKFLPLTFFKTWQHSEKIGGDSKWLSEEPDRGQVYEKEETVNGKNLTHQLCYNFYVMLEDDIENPMALPYLLKLKSTSANEARNLITFLTRAKSAGNIPWSLMFTIDTKPDIAKNQKPYIKVMIKPFMVDGKQVVVEASKRTAVDDWASTIMKQQKNLKAMYQEVRPAAQPVQKPVKNYAPGASN